MPCNGHIVAGSDLAAKFLLLSLQGVVGMLFSSSFLQKVCPLVSSFLLSQWTWLLPCLPHRAFLLGSCWPSKRHFFLLPLNPYQTGVAPGNLSSLHISHAVLSDSAFAELLSCRSPSNSLPSRPSSGHASSLGLPATALHPPPFF